MSHSSAGQSSAHSPFISILCTHLKSNYLKIPNLDIWDEHRNAYNFTGHNLIICHPPCAQWSRMHHFARINPIEKELANFCMIKVKSNGGIFEHPAGSSIFKHHGIPRSKIISVDQHWWGFPGRKRTYLFFNHVPVLQQPLNFNAIPRDITFLNPQLRSLMPLTFCEYLVRCCQMCLHLSDS